MFLQRCLFISCSLIPISTLALFYPHAGSSARVFERVSIPHVRGELLVRVDPTRPPDTLVHLELSLLVKVVHDYVHVPGLRLYQFDPSRDVEDMIRAFSSHDAVLYAEPNYFHRTAVNDPEYPRQWALENVGQSNGKTDADVNAEAMWQKHKGSRDVVIGIVDTGIDYNHPDLVANIWTNPAEIAGNNIDDDRNGYVDDIHGINAIRNTGNPMDDNMHGTHVSGTIGANGNNGIGVVGMAHEVQMAGCKFLSAGGSGSTADALKCMDYFAALKSRATNPVNVVATNNSWGGGGSSRAMIDALKVHERLGILFVAAAGNESNDNDHSDSFPANYDISNVISVAATDANDRLAGFSNYGKRKVHIAAPGVKILSTLPNNRYGELSGTSMATPHVTGLAAVIAANMNTLNYKGIKNLIMAGGQKIDAAAETTVTGRRIRGADIGGVGSLSCINQTIVARKFPADINYKLNLGQSLFLSAYNMNCAEDMGPLNLYDGPLGTITLDDKGQNGDILANDGYHSLNWQPSKAGEYKLKFNNNDTVTVTINDPNATPPHEGKAKAKPKQRGPNKL